MEFQRANGVFQAAWVVADLEAAMRHWIENCGVGPFFVMENLQIEKMRYRGQPHEINFSVALAQAGPTQIELIFQHDDLPSVYRDAIAMGQTGFHHVGVWAHDFDRELKAYVEQGFAVAFEGRSSGMRFAYVDTRRTLGSMVEILEENAAVRARFRDIADVAANWDGRDPIRRN